MTATLDIDHGRSTLRFERLINHPRARVWRAVTDPDELRAWFPSAVVYEPRVGAPMQFDFGGEHGLDAWPGEVLEWDPPSVFAFAWGEDVLRFQLSDEGDATRLVFTHSFAHQPGKEARDAAGWAACFEAFDALLDGADEPAMGDWARHHDEHVALFGELALEGPAGGARLRLQGPYVEVDGRPAVSVRLDDEPGVLVVLDDGRALEDGAAVEVRAGTVDEPGETLAGGVLRDPLAGVSR
jgi:uncharacterized protein YndB with AHSA1/START domain